MVVAAAAVQLLLVVVLQLEAVLLQVAVDLMLVHSILLPDSDVADPDLSVVALFVPSPEIVDTYLQHLL
jgi:hypothetical protein